MQRTPRNLGLTLVTTGALLALAAGPASAALLLAPDEGDYLRGTVTVSWVRQIPNSHVEIYIESSGSNLFPALCDPCAGNSIAWDTTRFADGREYLLDVLEFGGGNFLRTTSDGTFTIDNTAPSTQAVLSGAPGENGWYLDDVTVELLASDETAGVATTSYAIDGGAVQAYTGSFRVSGDGVHTVRYWSTDRAGNVEPGRSVEIRIDGAAPSYKMVDPQDGNLYVLDMRDPAGAALPVTLVVGDLTVTVEASDAASGVDRVEFYIDGVLRATDTTAPYEFEWAAGDERAGAHTVAARAVDVAGNAAGSAVEVLTVPTSAEGVGHTALDGGPPL